MRQLIENLTDKVFYLWDSSIRGENFPCEFLIRVEEINFIG